VSFQAHLTHIQTIIGPLPGAHSLAASDHDPHEIVRFGPRAISTQFHPEFTPEILSSIIKLRAEGLRQEGKNPEALLASVSETREATGLLRNFVQAYAHWAGAAYSLGLENGGTDCGNLDGVRRTCDHTAPMLT